MNIGGTFSDMQNIQQTVSKIGATNRTKHQQTVRHIETVDAKQEATKSELVNNAAEAQNDMNKAKGVFIDTLA